MAFKLKMLAGTEILETTVPSSIWFVLYQLGTERSNGNCLQPQTEGRDTKGNKFHDCMNVWL